MIIQNWLKTGKYLPKFMRDFHDQKDLFKAMHQLYSKSDTMDGCGVNWVNGQIYVIDCFLWFMARHGYTLQKNKTKIKFEEISNTISEENEKRTKRLTL